MAWITDIVGQQSQSAPFYHRLSSSGEKRSLAIDDADDFQSKKKKRESLLNLSSKVENDNIEKNVKMPVASVREAFTVCVLCDLHFLTELELEEHLYSILHHRALETEKGKDFVHECNLCSVKCKGLAEYVLHLRDEQHKEVVEKRKEAIEKNLKTGPVYGLIKYKETFIHPPTKKTKPVPRMKHLSERKKTISKDKYSHPDALPAPDVKKGELYDSYRRSQPASTNSTRPRTDVAFRGMNHQPWRYGNGGLAYGGPPFGRSPAQPPPFSQPFGWNPGYPRFGQFRSWNHSNYYDNNRSWQNDSYRNNQRFYMPDHHKPVDWKRRSENVIDRRQEKERESPKSSRTSDSKQNSKQPKKKSKKTLKKSKSKTPSPPNSRSSTPSSGKASSPRGSLKVADLRSSATKGRSSTSSKGKPSFKIPSSAADRPGANKPPSFLSNKLRANISTKRTSPYSKTKNSGSTSSITSSTHSKSSKSASDESSSSLTPLSSKPESTVIDETKRLRNKFHSVMSSIEPPMSTRTQSSTTAVSSSDVTSQWGSTDKVSQSTTSGTKHDDKMSADREFPSKPLITTPDSLESPSIIRDKLSELAQRKEKLRARDDVGKQFSEESTLILESQALGEKPTNGTSEDSAVLNKKDSLKPNLPKTDLPKPNLAKARSRLSSKPGQASSNASDSDTEKQARLANLMLKTRNKPPLNQLKTHGGGDHTRTGRFGIGKLTRDNEQALGLDETDLQDIMVSINEAEGVENGAALLSQKPFPTFPDAERTSQREGNLTSGPPVSRANSVPIPPQTTISPSAPRPSTAHPQQVNGHSNPSQASQPHKEDLSMKLLHMSEREELLHKQETEIKEKSSHLHQELDHVNSLLEQLLDRRKEIEQAVQKVDAEAEAIRVDLEGIRLDRLSMLRASAGSTSAPPNDNGAPVPSSVRTNRPDSRAHVTPTPQMSLNVTPNTSNNFKSPAFPDSQSSIMDTSSRNRSASGTPNTPLPVKGEQQPVPTHHSNPFPVPCDSIYYESNAMPNDSKPMTSSVDRILHKYLKEATTEREVTSSTTTSNSSAKKKTASKRRASSDAEVTSTTPYRDVELNRSNRRSDSRPIPTRQTKVGSSKKPPPSDPHLVKLDLEQPSPRDVTSSWVTAQNGSCDEFKSAATNHNPEPTTLTSEQSEIAHLRMRTLEYHSASVLSVYVTECGKILSCSKDKTLCVADCETGQLLERYDLPGIPFRTCIVCEGSWVTLYVVFVNDDGGKAMLSECNLHSVRICLQFDYPDVSHPRMRKLLGHDSCIMCIHQYHQLLYLGTRDGNVLIYCTKMNRVRDILDCHSPHAVCCLATGTDGARRVICCGSSDCTVSVRDADDGLLLKKLLGHNKSINCLQLHCNLLYSGASDRNVLVHNIRTGDVVYRFFNMHCGSIKSLYFHDDNIVTLCLDKSIRVLKAEPCRITGSPKALHNLPLSMHVQFHKLGGTWEQTNVLLAYAYVGCQDGRIEVIPLPQLAYKVPCLKQRNSFEVDSSMMDVCVKQEVKEEMMDTGMNLECLWNGCGASGFTNPSSLLTHINLFHATDAYKETLNSCCLWGNCAHYFSSDIDTALNVHLHMDKHVSDAVQLMRKS